MRNNGLGDSARAFTAHKHKVGIWMKAHPTFIVSNQKEESINMLGVKAYVIDRGSYMSAHVLLNLLNKLGKRYKMWGLPSILSLFRKEFDKINNTGARMLDSIYHTTFKLFCNHLLMWKRQDFGIYVTLLWSSFHYVTQTFVNLVFNAWRYITTRSAVIWVVPLWHRYRLSQLWIKFSFGFSRV